MSELLEYIIKAKEGKKLPPLTLPPSFVDNFPVQKIAQRGEEEDSFSRLVILFSIPNDKIDTPTFEADFIKLLVSEYLWHLNNAPERAIWGTISVDKVSVRTSELNTTDNTGLFFTFSLRRNNENQN